MKTFLFCIATAYSLIQGMERAYNTSIILKNESPFDVFISSDKEKDVLVGGKQADQIQTHSMNLDEIGSLKAIAKLPAREEQTAAGKTVVRGGRQEFNLDKAVEEAKKISREKGINAEMIIKPALGSLSFEVEPAKVMYVWEALPWLAKKWNSPDRNTITPADILAVDQRQPEAAIKKDAVVHYRELIRKLHPDKFGKGIQQQKYGTRVFQVINEAYERIGSTADAKMIEDLGKPIELSENEQFSIRKYVAELETPRVRLFGEMPQAVTESYIGK